MKIAQYKCALSHDSVVEELGLTVEAIDSVALGDSYDCDVLVWHNRFTFGAEQLAHFPNLKTFINWGTDDNELDESLLTSQGIAVKKVNYYSTETLAEYILSLILLFERQHIRLLAGEKFQGNELYRKKVGIVGLGKIGYRTAMMLQRAFNCQIFYASKEDKHIPNYIHTTMEALFASCDYIIIATKSPDLAIDITAMPVVNPRLVIVNITRDSIVPFTSLLPLLKNGGLRGLISDLPIDKGALGTIPDNALIMPHKGYLTRTSTEIKRNILLFYLRQAAMLAASFHVVRHSETEWNKVGKMQGSKDSPLSSKGRQHAKDIAATYVDSDVEYVFTSPQVRADTTARIIADTIGAKLIVVPEFAEMNFGIFEGKYKNDVEAMFADFFEERKQNQFFKLFVPFSGGESYYDVYLRVLRPLLRILSEGKPCIIVGHESVNRILRGIATEKSLEDMVLARQKNNEMVQINLVTGEETISLV